MTKKQTKKKKKTAVYINNAVLLQNIFPQYKMYVKPVITKSLSLKMLIFLRIKNKVCIFFSLHYC